MSLQPPDSHYLSGAVGWLELGNSAEAIQELNRINTRHQRDPNVLEVRWSIFAGQAKWDQCVEVATDLAQVAPDDPFGWIHLSYALHELKRTQEAYHNLQSVLPRFPDEWLMRYNMACYACQLGLHNEAERWLADASRTKGDKKGIRSMAENDPDLAALFKR